MPFELPQGWVWCRLDDTCQIFGRIGFRGYTKEDLVEKGKGAITLSPSNIVNNCMNYDNCTYISWAKYEESPEIKVENNDILLVKTGSSFGKCALVLELPFQATINPQFVVLKSITIHRHYLTHVLQSQYAREVYDNFVLGTAIPTFTQVALGNMRMPLPPFAEQQRIVDEVERWFKLIDTIEQGKADLQTAIKQAKNKILELAISGKLVPQDPTDEPASELLKRINPKAHFTCDNEHYPQLPKGWAITSMHEVCNLFDGEKQDYRSMINLDVKFLRRQSDGKVLKGGRYVPANTYMILVDGENSGEVFKTPIEGYQGSTFKQLSINENMNEEYVLHIINLHRKALRENKVGSAIPHLNKKLFKAIEVPIPPYAEQERIIVAINTVFRCLDTIEESL